MDDDKPAEIEAAPTRAGEVCEVMMLGRGDQDEMHPRCRGRKEKKGKSGGTKTGEAGGWRMGGWQLAGDPPRTLARRCAKPNAIVFLAGHVPGAACGVSRVST